MSDAFKKPFTAPPSIFAAAFAAGLTLELIFAVPMLAAAIQLVLGVALATGGALLIRASMSEIERAGTTYDPFAASTHLVTSGVYRFTRNPGYLGLAIIQTGLAVMIDGLWIALMTLPAVVVTHVFVIRLEEAKLRAAFADEYERYLERVRPWL